MVLETILRENIIKNRKGLAIILGIVYSVVGLVSARLMFGPYVGLMSIAFIAVLLLPSIMYLISKEEAVEVREKKFSLRLIFKDHKDIIEIYLFIFLGIFLTFLFVSAAFPPQTTAEYFYPQLQMLNTKDRLHESGVPGWFDIFGSLIKNNLIISLISFVLSFGYGSGALVIITWNATVWGAISGNLIGYSVANISVFFLFLPHIILEILAYLLVAVSGGVLSKAVIKEKLASKRFYHVMTDAIMLFLMGLAILVIAAVIEALVIVSLLS